MEINKIYQSDCIEFMKSLPDNSIDAVITDPPYGTTNCKWDKAIPFELMWAELNRIVKKNAAIVLFGSQPFSSQLICSNIKNFKYEWVWNKRIGGNPLNAKVMPMKIHENIMVFNKHNYYPIMTQGEMKSKGFGLKKPMEQFNRTSLERKPKKNDLYYPKSILDNNTFSKGNRGRKEEFLHPTQKPLELIKYLVLTYSQKDDIVLDFAMGSGTTAVACKELNRNFIGCEINPDYIQIANKRVKYAIKNIF